MNQSQDKPAGPRILIASASVGAGHNQAAGAVAAALRARMPAARVEVVDVLQFSPWAFRAYYAGGYSLSVTKFPRCYGLGFWMTDRPQGPQRGPGECSRLWHERLHLRRFARYVCESRPDLVIHTHFLASPLLGRMIRQGELWTRQLVVVTDIRMHRYWYSEDVDHWFAPAQPVADHLRQWGIDPRRITVSGMPIHPKWTAPLDRDTVLNDWRLPADRPIVLLCGGTEFTCGPVVKIARQILARCPKAFLAVLAGRNKKLLAKLGRLPQAGQDLMPVAFTDRIHELVEVATMMVTKAGGLSTAECLAKGAPMVLLPPVPGQESGNAAYFARQGAAVVAANPADVVEQVARLLKNPVELSGMADKARRLYRPATETIVAAVSKLLGRETGDGA